VDIAKAVAKEMMDLRRIESEETRAGAKIGADLVTFGAQLEAEERRQGVSLGKEIAENIRKDARTVQEMDQMTKEKEKDRQAMLEKARLDAANRRAAAKKSGDK
jgi:Zn-dependent oligopeptidase